MSETRLKSPSVIFEHISPNSNNPRTKKIKRLTPHCVAGNLTIEATLRLPAFQAGGRASTNYAIGTDGRIGLGVAEPNRAWTSSSPANDNEAITFEIANNSGAPDWRMSDAAINSWLDLAVDICRFYNFKKVNYVEKPANITIAQIETWIKTWAKRNEMIITLHNWYAAKACPGPYFMRQLPWLVREMNRRLQDPKWEPEAFIGEGAARFTNSNPTIITQVTRPTAQEIEKIIWNFFKSKNLNDFAIAGIMGNLFAESGLRSNALQRSFHSVLNMTDESYTSGVDNQTYTNFVNDSAGYGLSQWTFHSRKQELLNASRAANTSIGDLTMQLNFMWNELQRYGNVMSLLSNVNSVFTASNVILLHYMKPADQSTIVQNRRAEYAQDYFSRLTQISTSIRIEPAVDTDFIEYQVTIATPALNVRQGPGLNYKSVKILLNDKNVYTIVEESIGPGTERWGRLKSGLGWISLDFTKRK